MTRFTKTMLPLAVAVSAATFASTAGALEWHGYFRSGVGGASEDGDQACFSIAPHGHKYRLGNECETYIETVFADRLLEASNGTYFDLALTFAHVVDGEDDFETFAPAAREAYIEAGNVFEGPLQGATFWAGKRFYRRHDVHINDFYFWDTSGPGGGVQDVDVGVGKVAYAWLRDVGDKNNAASFHDLRIYDIDANPGGKLTFGVAYQNPDEDVAGADSEGGWLLNAIHFQDGLLGGFNKLTLQYGNGPAATTLGRQGADPGGQLAADTDDSAWRIVEMLLVEPDPSWSALGTIIYEDQSDNDSATFDNWLSIGARPQYYVTDYLNIALEVGYDQVEPVGSGDEAELWKISLAPQISAGRGFWTRPLLRAFVTYADWNDAATPTIVSRSDARFAEETDGWSYGVQAEAWW